MSFIKPSLITALVMLLTAVMDTAAAPLQGNDDAECGSNQCSEAMQQLVKFSRNGSVDAQVIVAVAYANGDGVQQDLTLARQHLKRALRNNDERAWHIYSQWLRAGIGYDINLVTANRALDRAADRGYVPALYERAIRQFSEQASDNSQVVDDLERAAAKLHKPAMYLLAQIKAAGLGVALDQQGASKLYGYLARSDYQQSRQRLQLLLGDEDDIDGAAEQLATALVSDLAGPQYDPEQQSIEVITVSASRIDTEEYIIDLADIIDQQKLFDGRSTGTRIPGQVCGQGVAQCRVLYSRASERSTIGGTIIEAFSLQGF